jgi:hypothetical protein
MGRPIRKGELGFARFQDILKGTACRASTGDPSCRRDALRCVRTRRPASTGASRCAPTSRWPTCHSCGSRNPEVFGGMGGLEHGLDESSPYVTVAAGFVSLYPPYNGAVCPLGRAEGLQMSSHEPLPVIPAKAGIQGLGGISGVEHGLDESSPYTPFFAAYSTTGACRGARFQGPDYEG